MSPLLDRLREEILALPLPDRESLIASIRESDHLSPLGLHPAWAAEIDRRMQNFYDGKAELLSEEEVELELQQMLEEK